MRGVGLSHEIPNVAEAEAVPMVEGKMCGAVMRGADAPPGSKATSRLKGARRNLGGLMTDRWARAPQGPHREGEEPSPMMYGHEKSDRCVVPRKSANKAGLVSCGGADGGKAPGQGKCGASGHTPDTELGKL